MGKYLDHPLRLARASRGFGQSRLADAAGIARSTLIAIEDDRTQTISPTTMDAIADALTIDATALERDIHDWRKRRFVEGLQLSPVARQVLHLSPSEIPKRFSTFEQWRDSVAPSASAFAAMLGLNHMTVLNYGKGVRQSGMPMVLVNALISRMGLSREYVVELEKLEPREEPS